MIKKLTLSTLLLCGSGFSLAEVAAPEQTEANATQLETMQIRSTAVDTSIPLDLPVNASSRLGLTVRETPASIDVITRELMRERGNTTTQQALTNSAGVVASQCFGVTCVSMRGFSSTLQPLYNGLRYPGLAITPRGTFNYDRIEVIKGLSSMQHGIGTVGGAVNFVTKAADGREEKEVLLAYDRWNTKTIGLGIGGKATDALAYRADLSYKGANKGSYGWVDNSSYDYAHFTGELALQATDTFKVTLSEEYYQDNGEGYFGTPHVNGNIVKSTRYNNYNVDDDQMDKEANWTRLNLEWSPTDKIKLRNETYYNNENRIWKNTEAYVYNAVTNKVNRSDFLHIKHDQKLVGNRTEISFDHQLGNMRNRVMAGFDIAKNEHLRTNNAPYVSPASAVDFITPQSGVFTTTSAYTPNRKTELVQKAFFVEDYLNLTEQFKLSLSARHDKIDLDSDNLRIATATNPATFSTDYSGNSYRVGAVYDITPSLSIYGQWANALEPAAQLVTLTYAQRNYKLGRAKQKEIGLKGSLPNNLGEVTVGLFDINRTDILTRDPLNPGQSIQIGEQTSRGIELTAALRPIDQWTVEGNASILNAEFDKFYESVGGVAVSRAGNLPPDVPEKTANLWITYRPNSDWKISLGSHFVGKRSGDNANTATRYMDGYTIYDASLGYKLGKGELMFSVRNLTDKLYADRTYNSGNQFMLGEPRTAEISWSAKF
ncbi:TonB-dependent siderophore receptor [Methylotenera sp.]|uniref:TonB-dependent receptor n=1 Tax=Methylotenera sp. TaxID=2051956 RepID=UPI00273147A4|nr:TonB-dependent receptor [Methylotenera sp.]MDP2071153.1 TonB-dependent receptor [Methylotenera sp.]MDP3007316.1 TonB-dependent receptor [Methylotenera sp.]